MVLGVSGLQQLVDDVNVYGRSVFAVLGVIVMQEYEQMLKRQKKWMLYYLACLALGVALTSYHHVITGLFLGTVLSFYNLWLLQRKITKFGDVIVNGSKMFGLGTFTRIATVILALIIGYEYETYFHLGAIVGGLMTMHLVIIIDFAIFHTKDSI